MQMFWNSDIIIPSIFIGKQVFYCVAKQIVYVIQKEKLTKTQTVNHRLLLDIIYTFTVYDITLPVAPINIMISYKLLDIM